MADVVFAPEKGVTLMNKHEFYVWLLVVFALILFFKS